jgi:hypothetical protein
MVVGETTSGSLTDALPSIIADARIVKEDAGTWMRTTDVRRQKAGTGRSWQEFALSQVAGQDITESTNNQNFQQLQGTLFSIEPTMSQIVIKITDRTFRKIAAVVTSKTGGLAGNAMNRKQDEDYLALFTTFATTTSPGAGNPLSFGHIAAAVANTESNVTEPSLAEVFTVLHGFQIKDIQDEILSGIGTYAIPEGMTADTFRKGFAGTVAGSNVFKDGNIGIDSSSDALGATHSREGVVAAIGMDIKKETGRDMLFGGGADVISLVNEYAFAERKSGTTQVWAYLLKSDASQPTS